MTPPTSRRRAPRTATAALLLALVGAGLPAAGQTYGPQADAGARADTAAAVFDARVPPYGPMLVSTDAGRALLDEGRAAMIAFRLDEAEALFRRLDAAEPASPAGRYHLATLALWRALMNEREPYYGRFFAAADTLDDRLDGLPDSPWATHFEAEVAFQRAVVYAKQERYPKAGLALRAAYGRYEANLRRHPEFWESYKGMGLCHVAVGSVPRAYRWILSVFGFGGTVQEGMEELTTALHRSAYSREEAALYLAVVDAILNEGKAGAIRHVAALHAAYPESPMPAYLHAFLLLGERQAEAAEAALRDAVAHQAAAGVDAIPYVDYYLGEALFRQNRFEEALPRFEAYARSYRGHALLASAHLHAGLAREMTGDRDGAVAHYRRVQAGRDYDSDRSARRRAAQLLERPMSDSERTLLLGQNDYDAGRYRAAVRTLQPVLGDPDAEAAHRAEAAYRSGRAFQALGESEEALRHYRVAASNPGDPLAKWGPWSQYHIGEVHEEMGDAEAARRAYRAVLDNEDEFDYHKALEQRARTALGRL
ncbi:MAG: tetratricopeptide repeat protein [Rubricoccaceae bacterium]|nr:tetratricopeptide repeat protein [Rubricoccaceae bacterium]